eukprot:CAMPEP_0118849878 /NCGR_PEP_ID=MMETSP1162-20130426/94187_1 /TAXON_ID=33656 /ORGANISM="Phaeocystis Sp, Strain CCMP2710" /LENGTH=273 /DNA_ID=CAMNT_0006782067 /DNA_START=29 /DNA_END=852 /DNA_ORIENTATION=+
MTRAGCAAFASPMGSSSLLLRCGLCAAAAVERLLRALLPAHVRIPHDLAAVGDIAHAHHADRPWRRAARVLAQPPAAGGEGRVAAHVQQMQRLQAAARTPLLPVRPVRDEDGPPLPVGEQLRRRQQPEALRALRRVHRRDGGYALFLLCLRTLNAVPAGGGPPSGQIGRFRGGAHVDGGNFVMMALLFFEAILFGLFTLAMFTEQISSILSDQTGIERLKNDYVAMEQRSAMANLSETFGRPFSLLWLVPTAVKFHGLTYRDMLAYELEEHCV